MKTYVARQPIYGNDFSVYGYELKDKGFVLAMDDYVNNPYFDKIIEIADIVKVDFRQMEDDSKYGLPGRSKFKDKIMLAEKIETKEEFERAKRGNYSYFQGYYFMKPIVFSKTEMNILPVTYSRMLEEMGVSPAVKAALLGGGKYIQRNA